MLWWSRCVREWRDGKGLEYPESMNDRIFSPRRFRALRACLVTAAACALTLTGLYVATPSAQAENDKVDLSVDVRDRDASGAPKTSYWSGESVSPVVRFSASGTTLSIPGATLTVCATALPYENMGEVPDDAPQLTPSTVAESSTRYVIYDGQRLGYVPGKKYGIDAKTWSYHSGDQWCIDYRYTEIKGGMLGGFPAPFTFRNGVTPNGTTRTITAVLKESDGKIRIQDSLTLTARSSSDFTSGMLFEGSAWEETLSDGRKVPNFPYDALGERQKTNTPHYPFTESNRHAVFADPATDSSAPAGTGAFDATTIRYLVKLPVGATIHRSAHLGFADWVLDPIAHTATWEGAADQWPRGSVCPNHRYCRPITINMQDVPVYTDPVNKVKKIYEISSIITLDPGLPTERVLPEHRDEFVFQPRVANDGQFSYGIDTERHWGDHTISYSNGSYSQYGSTVDPLVQAKDLLLWGVYLGNSNSDLPPGGQTPTPGQGLYEEVASFRVHSLDPRLYFNSLVIPRGLVRWKQNGRQNAPTQEFVDAFNAADAALYGVKSDGTRELIQDHLRAQESQDVYIPIRDEARTYSELEVVFAQPYVVDNFTAVFQVSTYLTAADRQKWDSGGYPAEKNQSDYTVDMAVVHRAHGETTSTNSETDPDKTWNWMSYGPTTPRTQIRAGLGSKGTRDETYETTLVYDDCPGVTTLTPENCKRVKNYQVVSYPEGNWMGQTRSWKNLKHIVLLPSGVKYLRTTKTVLFDEQSLPTPIEPRVVDNFRGTGRTALVYSYGDVSKELLSWFQYSGAIISAFDLDTTLQAEVAPAVNTVDYYVTWDDNAISQPQETKNGDVYTDALDLDGDGNTEEKFLHTVMRIKLTPPAEVFARKNSSLDGQQWFAQTPPQDLGSDLYYRYTVINNTDDSLARLSVLDVLPQENDHDIVSQKDGTYKPRNWESVGVDGTPLMGEHSGLTTPLTQGLDTVPANAALQSELGVSANDLFDYFYSLTPQGADLASVRDVQWLTSDEVAGRWNQVMSVKAVLKAGKVLPGNKTAYVVTHNQVPYNEETRAVTRHSRAVSSLAYSTDGVSYVEASGRVESSNTSYTLNGLAFSDTNKNGNYDAGETPIAGRAFTVVHADGTPAHDPAGNALSGVTDAQGRYSLPIYTRGTYQVKFASDTSEEISPLGNGTTDVANHATLAPPTPGGSAGGLYALTSAVELNPEHLSGTRNVGVYSLTRDIALHKVDDGGNALRGVGFTLTWKEPLPGNGAPAATPAPVTLRTDEAGNITFASVLHGRYTLSETGVPQGYTQASDITLEVDGQGVRRLGENQQLDTVNITNTQIKGNVTLTKVDDKTRATLAGAVFELYRKGADGRVPEGSAPAYTLPATGADGTTSLTDVLYGEYELREKVAPVGYVLSNERPTVSVTENGRTVNVGEFGNHQFLASVRVSKIAELPDPHADKVPQEGVEFGLYEVAADGSVAATTTRTALTDVTGNALFENVPFGTYRVKEKTPRNSHRPSAETEGRPVVIDGSRTQVDYSADPFINHIKRGAITVAKVDRDQPTVKLAGVSFGLYRAGSAGVNEELVEVVQTDAQGIATFANVAYGDYLVKETASIEGYVRDDSDVREAHIREHGQVVDLSGSPVTNQKILGSIRIAKKDAQSREALAGAEFTLTSLADGSTVERTRSAADGSVVFTRVPYGLYEVTETQAPEGYVLDGYSALVNISTHGETVDLGDVFNARLRGEIVVQKIDAEAGAPIEGVVFGLFPASEAGAAAVPAGANPSAPGSGTQKAPRATALTDRDGIARFPGISSGSYVVREMTPAPGYLLEEQPVELTASVSTPGEVVEAGVVTNRLIRGDVRALKVDGQGRPLAGVVFELRGGARNETLTATSAADGTVLFSNVAYGQWTLSEVHAPEGYVMDRATRDVEVTSSGVVVEVGTIVNQKNPKMAVTGAHTGSLLAALVTAAGTGGAVMWCARRRRRSGH